MADLKTRYMGIELKNPIIAGACSATSDISTIKKLADSGVAAIVVKSLFQEQVVLEELKMEQELHAHDNLSPEMINFFHEFKHAGPSEHIMWVKKTRDEVDIPLIASINAFDKDCWVDYAVKLAETGVDALELNLFNIPTDHSQSSDDIETEQIDAIKAVKAAVDIPIAVKLTPFYTNIAGFVKRLDAIGVDGFVLFNKMFQPDINIESEANIYPYNLSGPRELRLPLRYAGLLHGDIKADICASTGVLSGKDAVKMIMVGAAAVQMVTSLYRDGIQKVSANVDEIAQWMDAKGYATLDDFRGKKDAQNNTDKWFYDRAQYVRILMQGDPKV